MPAVLCVACRGCGKEVGTDLELIVNYSQQNRSVGHLLTIATMYGLIFALMDRFFWNPAGMHHRTHTHTHTHITARTATRVGDY